jgi:hypothetical protein
VGIGPAGPRAREASNDVKVLTRWLWRLAPYAIVLLLAAIETAAIVYFCDGKFFYTLDDPYIHLALSDNIFHGHYGLNAGEFSSPSSSILYPFLLAATSPLWLHEYAPLAVNLLAMLATLAMTLQLLARAGLASLDRPLRRALLAVGFIVYTNTFGIVFTGMEHSLQFALAIAGATGLIVFLEEDRLPWRLPIAIVVGPLVRYEALPMSLAMLGVLATLRPRTAVALLFGMALPLAAFSAALHYLGLPLLPGSILAKVDFAGILANPRERWEVALRKAKFLEGLFVVLLATQLFKSLRTIPVRLILLVCLAMAAAHLLFGSYGGLFRYEGYVLVTWAAFAVYFYRRFLAALLDNRRLATAVTLAAVAALPLGWFINFPAIVNPLAARNIYEQQYQMHRFAVDFHHGPLAVNDLGCVAYDNPYYVLDLFGLGSETARVGRQSGAPEWMQRLAAEKHVTVAAIYPNWFDNKLPPMWTPLARLKLSGKKISAAGAAVTFYATDPAASGALLQELAAFAATLPAGVALEFLGPPGPPAPAVPSGGLAV